MAAPSPADVFPASVELREDVPLKGSRGGGWWGWCGGGGGGGPRVVATCFGALSVGITVALMAQVYSGDYEVVPHGSVASGAAECSRAGTDLLKAGGRALDAAAATALCLAVASPHLTSLDASGSMLYWEYRSQRSVEPSAVEWGGAGVGGGAAARPPRLVAALAALHARLGALPWARLLQPAIQLARSGLPVSEGLAQAQAAHGSAPALAANRTAPELADFLESLQMNTSAELSAAWHSDSIIRSFSVPQRSAGRWRVYAGGAGAAPAQRALAAALAPPPAGADEAEARAVAALQQEAAASPAFPPPSTPTTGLAVVDHLDTYLALVTGLSTLFGSGPASGAGWTRDEPTHELDLAPAIMTDEHVCGTRYVLGGESSAALVQAGAALGAGEGAGGVERARLALGAGGALAAEALRAAPGVPPPRSLGAPPLNASLPYAAVNLVQQTADALLSHADSRGGGLASRF